MKNLGGDYQRENKIFLPSLSEILVNWHRLVRTALAFLFPCWAWWKKSASPSQPIECKKKKFIWSPAFQSLTTIYLYLLWILNNIYNNFAIFHKKFLFCSDCLLRVIQFWLFSVEECSMSALYELPYLVRDQGKRNDYSWYHQLTQVDKYPQKI